MACFVAEHALLRTHIQILPHHLSLAHLWHTRAIKPSCVLALDFDQTLSLVRTSGGARVKTLRGGEPTLNALQEMRREGVRMVVLSAQSPSIATVENMAREMAELGIAELFDVQPAERRFGEDWLRAKWEERAEGGERGEGKGRKGKEMEDASRRLLLLLLLRGERKASDLCRIALSSCVLSAEAIMYRMRSVGGEGWSTEQRLPCNSQDPSLCPVRAWRMYMESTAHLRTPRGRGVELDQLFLSVSAAASGCGVAMQGGEVVHLLRQELASAGYSARDVAWWLEPHSTELLLEGGLK
ncbi:MAG: hypothetical protein SGPRY_013063, partial [Prymnesium sp.]